MNWEISYKFHSALLMLACPGDAGSGCRFPMNERKRGQVLPRAGVKIRGQFFHRAPGCTVQDLTPMFQFLLCGCLADNSQLAEGASLAARYPSLRTGGIC